MGGMGQFSGRMDGDVQLGIRTKLCPPCSSRLSVQVVIAWRTGKIIRTNVCSVAYLGGGPCARAPPPFGRTAVIFVTILGLFLAPFRDKIAATSDQVRFLGRKML